MTNSFTLAGVLAKIQMTEQPDTGTRAAVLIVKMLQPSGKATDFHLSMLGDSADKAARVFQKGIPAVITGRQILSVDKSDSQIIYNVRFIGTSIELLENENQVLGYLEVTENQEELPS